MKLREKAAKAIDTLMGTENNVGELSIKRLIDTFESFTVEIAKESYEKGNNDGADGVNKVVQYLHGLRK